MNAPTAIICLSVFGFGIVVPAAGQLIFVGDFETGGTGVGRLGTAGLDEALKRTCLVTSPVRAGRQALEVTLDRAGGDHRTDFYIRDVGGRFKVGREYWFGFSVRFPDDWQPDTQNELFAQWVRTTRVPAGPQLAFYVQGPNLVIRKRWDPNPNDSLQDVRTTNLWRGSLLEDCGGWVDWVVHVNWSKGRDGSIKIWKNRDLIVDDSGPNCYNDGDDQAPYFKFGIYKWPWAKSISESPSTVSVRRLVFDEIRIGDDRATFETVMPHDHR